MRCPHCTVTIHPVWEYGWIDEVRGDRPCWQWVKTICPACQNTFIKAHLRTIFGGEVPDQEAEPPYAEVWIEPASPKRRPVAEVIPSNLAADYEEALAVLAISPKASAALSRRVLQSILDEQGYVGRNLANQIDRVLAEKQGDKVLPTSVRDTVDVIRNVGNFAAHAITDDTILQVIPVSREEAEWCLTIIEALFDHYYVIPATNKKRLDDFKQKLAHAGRRTTRS